MSCPGEWIDFEELCRRVPLRSPRTLRRDIAARRISSRQLVRGGKREFNWRTVQRELAAMECGPALSEAAAPATTGEGMNEVRAELRALRATIERLLAVAQAKGARG